MIFYTSGKVLKLVSNGFLKLTHRVLLLNVKVDMEKAKAKGLTDIKAN